MILKLLAALSIGICIISCTSDSKKSIKAEPDATNNDIHIGSKDFTDDGHTKRAKTYFVITGKDTSDFTCTFFELQEFDGIKMRIEDDKKKLSYQQRMNELAKILPVAAKDYPMDSLRSINIGRLVSNGDLAIDVTNEYTKKFGEKTTAKDSKIPLAFLDYKKVSAFLLETKLASDFNALFKPYSLTVSSLSLEKPFFTSKESLYLSSKIETDSTLVPDKILDAYIWLNLK